MPRKAPEQITLAEMSKKLNSMFLAHLDEPISELTPYDWWKRTKLGEISEPLPKPLMIVGRSPVFKWSEIVAWFVRYKGLAKAKVKVEE